MKALFPLALFGMLAAGSGGATANSKSLNEFKPGIMPVLVQVNAQGKVTDASPPTQLSPQLNRLLRQNLAEMVSKPATDSHGHPIASQVNNNVALHTTPRAEGDYDANFAYVSTKPVPNGSWYWVHVDGHRLALANRDNRWNRRIFDVDHYRPDYHPRHIPVRQLPPPPIRNASQSTPPAASRLGR
jgi:hypothetical protein